MSKYLFSLAFLLICTLPTVTAQNNKVERLMVKNESAPLTAEELKEGKLLVDQNITDSKLKDQAKTWYLRGKMYALLYETKNNFSGLKKSDCLQQFYESRQKVKQLAGSNDTYVTLMETEYEKLWGNVLNQGVTQYQNNNLTSAIKYFERTSILKPTDTLGYIYAATVANEAQKYNVALKNYKQLVKINPKADYYAMIIVLQMEYIQDNQGAMNTIKEAKSVLGDSNAKINKYEIDLLIRTNKTDQALSQLNAAIEAEPFNDLLHTRKGLLLDQLIANEKRAASPNKAKIDKLTSEGIKAYQQAIKLNNENSMAYYNLAVLYSGQANELYQKANNLSLDDYKTKGAKLEQQGNDLIKKALPFMEKAHALDPEDIGALQALQIFYSRLEMMGKYKEIQTKLKALGY